MSKAVIALAILAIVGAQYSGYGTLTDGDITAYWNVGDSTAIFVLVVNTTSTLKSYYALGIRNGTATGLQGAEYGYVAVDGSSATLTTKITTNSSSVPADDDLTVTGTSTSITTADGASVLTASWTRNLEDSNSDLTLTEGDKLEVIIVESDNADFSGATYSETEVTFSNTYSGEADDNAISIALSFALVGLLNLF